MSRLKKLLLKPVEPKPSKGSELLEGWTVEYDSCYRGKIEIWKDGNGEVVRTIIVR